jgi:uncharacterized membrane protein YfcA
VNDAESTLLPLVAIGLSAGVLSGVFGFGGGVIIVPAPMYIAGLRQHAATGTSLAVLPPLGIGAAIEYYRNGNVEPRSAIVLALTMTVGGYFGAVAANRLAGPYLRLGFGAFVLSLGIYLMCGAFVRLGWL